MAQYEDIKAGLAGLDPLSAPTPGASLTRSPNMKAPYEKPPQFTDKDEAVEAIFMNMTREDTIDDFLDLLRIGTPVEYIAQVVLFEGFRSGKFNPDLMLLLIEPVIYIILWLADYANIDDVVIYPEDDMGLSKISVTPEGNIQAGDREIQRPESVSSTLLERIASTQGEE